MTKSPISLQLMTPETAEADAAAVLNMVQKQLGFVPNLYAHMANMPALLVSYTNGYEKFRAQAGFTPAEQEVIFLTISEVNGCHYCLAAHSMVADKMQGMGADLINGLRAGAPLSDAKLNALAVFTRKMVTSHGRPGADAMAAFFEAGYDTQAVLGVVLGVSVKTLSNYVNSLSQTPVDAAFTDYKVDT